MNTNKSLLNKIKKGGIALSLGLGFLLLSDVEANAQTWGNQRRENRQERREDRRDARAEGYRDGLEEGAEDARAGRRLNPYTENSYRGADGHNSRAEIQAYRTAFVQGYREGYNRYRRSNYRTIYRRNY
jgi:hypothetical protein